MGGYSKTSIILMLCVLLVLSILSTVPSASSEPTQDSTFTAQYDVSNQKLFVSIQPSLIAYYSNMSHMIAKDEDYAKLVTPVAVQSLAENVQKTIQGTPYSDEAFANAVLSIVHQIPYNITGAKYPVETLVGNRGDCGSLSILAASILKAGGLDVVLIKYTGIDPNHMNVGVYLPHTPMYHNLLLSPASFSFNNKTYWVAEATPQSDWKVGDQSYTMANAIPIIIPLDNTLETSPGQVASNFDVSPAPSEITINVSELPANMTDKGRALLISGSIQPASPNSNVSLFINGNGSLANYYSLATDDMGAYAFVWNLTKDGTYYITATSSGNGTNLGADSETLVACIGPQSLLQFQSDTYNYMIGVPFGDVAVRPFIGIEDFLQVPLGTNLSLSYDFRVLQTGSAESAFTPINVTVPEREYTISDRRGRTQVIEVPSQVRTVPTSMPLGMTPLALPNDFNQTVNSNFCVIVQSDPDGNYSLRVKGLNDYDVSDIQQDNRTGAFLNATEGVQESIWYTVTTTISPNGIGAELQEANGVYSDNLTALNNLRDGNQLVLLLTKNVDSAVVLKDFKIQAVNAPSPKPEPTNPMPHSLTIPLAAIYAMVVMALVFAMATIYVKKRIDGKSSV